jgi:hypothetical protein
MSQGVPGLSFATAAAPMVITVDNHSFVNLKRGQQAVGDVKNVNVKHRTYLNPTE